MILAFLGALAIGLSLGLLGSGGSILTVPVLVYLLDQPEKVAIAGSLAIVAGIAAAGAIPYGIQRRIEWRSVAYFAPPGMVGTYGGAWLAAYISGTLQLTLFAVVMLAASWMMFRPQTLPDSDAEPVSRAYWKIAIDGLIVGVITGLVGVGGGFLIVPALVLLGGLSMQRAVGTSLVIITLKSLAGFYKYLGVLAAAGLALDWTVLAVVTGVGAVGSLVGNAVAGRLPQASLKRGFAVFLVLMAAFILYRNVPTLLN
jgi:uncharacterized membrane protein YfcA